MPDVRIVELAEAELDDRLDDIVEVYAAALGEDRSAAKDRLQTEVLPRHRARDGFRFLIALDDPQVVGIAYGYVGSRGQWWTDRVAAAMSPADQARWLDPPHFEVVELHVRPDHQRQGIGRRLLADLTAGLKLPHALLSTDEGNSRARSFYAALGWQEILGGVDLSSTRGTYVILARALQ